MQGEVMLNVGVQPVSMKEMKLDSVLEKYLRDNKVKKRKRATRKRN